MKRLAVIGSRGFDDYEFLCKELHEYDKSYGPITEIITGGAKGADKLAERFAKNHNIKVTVLYAKWNDLSVDKCVVKTNKHGKKYNALAGFNRNMEMLDLCDEVIAFWDGKSKGTKHMIIKATDSKKICHVRLYDYL